MPTQLECTAQGCNNGEGGAQWKTPALEAQYALEMLDGHRADVHGQQVGRGGEAVQDGGGKIQLANIPRPVVSGGCSQGDFKYFKRTWNQYVRPSNEKDEVKIRDQLLHCPDKALKKSVNTLALMTAKQKRDELVRQFAARLCGLAVMCDLTLTCTCQLVRWTSGCYCPSSVG